MISKAISMKKQFAINWQAALVTIVIASFAAGSAVAQTTPLRWKFAKSDQFEIAIEQTTKLETEADLVKQNIDTSSAVKFRWFVQELDAKGIAQIDMVLQSVQLKITMPVSNGVRTLEVDTAATPVAKPDVQETEMLQNLQAVLGKTIRLQVTDRGEIISVELDAATKESLRLAPQSMQIRQMLTDDGLRELFASGAPVLPENEIKKGESWTVDKDFAIPAGQFRREQKLTWLGNETHDNVSQEKIDVTAQLSLLSPAPNSAKPSEVATKLAIKSQNTTGTIWFDSEKGMITQGSVASSLVTESRYRDKAIVTRISSQVELNVRREK